MEHLIDTYLLWLLKDSQTEENLDNENEGNKRTPKTKDRWVNSVFQRSNSQKKKTFLIIFFQIGFWTFCPKISMELYSHFSTSHNGN